MIAVPFVSLPLASGLLTKFRLSRLAALQPRVQQEVVEREEPVSAIRAAAEEEKDPSLTIRPRRVRLTLRGFGYTAGMAVLTTVLLWLLFLVLQGIAVSSYAAAARYMVAIFVDIWALWSCISFFRTRIRERRLFMNGELSQGHVLNQSETRYGRQIVYGYRDASGTAHQKPATDFSNKLYEEMPIHIFYDPLDPSESAALEGSLYRLT